MTDKKNKEQTNNPVKKIFAEGRGRYTLVDSVKVYHFDFPITNSLAENYSMISFIRDEIFNKMTEQKKKEEETKNQESCKKDSQEDKISS